MITDAARPRLEHAVKPKSLIRPSGFIGPIFKLHQARLLAAILAYMLLVWPSASLGLSHPNPVLATIGDIELRVHDFSEYLSKRHQLQARVAMGHDVGLAFLEFVDHKLFSLEGPRIGVRPREGETTQSEFYIFRVRTRLVGRCREPNQEQAELFFRANRDLFATPAMVRVSRIVLPAEVILDGLPAEDFLNGKVPQILSGRQTFDDLVLLAKALDPRSPEMGDLGFVPVPPASRRSDPLEHRLADASVGDLIGPFKHEGMVFLLNIQDRREPVFADFEAVQDQVSRRMMRQCQDEGLSRVREELYKRYDVRLNEDAISRLQPMGMAPQE